MAVGPGGVKHLCYFVSVCLGQRLRCREVRQQCAGGRAGGRVAKECLELWKRGRGDLLELVLATGDLSGQFFEVTYHHPQRSSIAIAIVPSSALAAAICWRTAVLSPRPPRMPNANLVAQACRAAPRSSIVTSARRSP